MSDRSNRRSESVRVGLVGYGIAGAVFHAPLISTTPGLTLGAVVTRDRQNAAEIGRRYPGAVVVPTVEELLRRPDIELVVVASPNRTHVPVARAAIDRGLAVIVDKPLAVTSGEAEGLAALARERRVPLTVFQNRRWDNDFLTAQELVRGGQLGSLYRFESRYERWRPAVKDGWRESPDPADGGGVLYDLGSHLIDQAISLFGPVESVYAEMRVRRPGGLVDDDTFVALPHRSGVVSHLWMSAVAAQIGPRYRMLGASGGYVKDGLDPQEADLRAGMLPRQGAVWGAEPKENWGLVGTDAHRQAFPTRDGDYPAFYRQMAGVFFDGTDVPVPPADAVLCLKVIERARQSAASGHAVTISQEQTS
jgi:scyllo-inositol 2-dehydrogenase (NADP+)